MENTNNKMMKVKRGEEYRRALLPLPCTLETLAQILKQQIFPGMEGDFVLTYRDDEGDYVTIGSDPELQEAFFQTKGSILRVEIEKRGGMVIKRERMPPVKVDEKEGPNVALRQKMSLPNEARRITRGGPVPRCGVVSGKTSGPLSESAERQKGQGGRFRRRNMMMRGPRAVRVEPPKMVEKREEQQQGEVWVGRGNHPMRGWALRRAMRDIPQQEKGEFMC